jgi:S-adenosylmethionine-diacylgycerolhomoserine-N-methlytransferase
MLERAGTSVALAGLQGRIRLAHADAVGFDPLKVFGRPAFDRIFISYAVSMIPGWRAVMADAFRSLAPGGELHVVDFGDQRDLPRWFRAVLRTWLGWYHVAPRADLFAVSAEIAASGDATTETKSLHGGFAWISVVRKPVLA